MQIRWEENVATSKSAAEHESETKQWDRILKMLMHTTPADLVSWVVKGGVYTGELNVELQSKAPIRADLLYTIEVGGRKGILHVEFQSTQDKRMDRRAWEYSCLASIHARTASLLSRHLRRETNNVNRRATLSDGISGRVYQSSFHLSEYQNVGDPAGGSQTTKPAGSAPALTTDQGKRRESRDGRRNDRRAWSKLAEPISCLSDTCFRHIPSVKRMSNNGSRKRFNKMKDLLEDNWAYREMVQWAEEKALEQGEKRGLEQGVKQGKQERLGARFEQAFARQACFALSRPISQINSHSRKQQIELTTSPVANTRPA